MTTSLEFNCNFIDGAYLEVKGHERDEFIVECNDLDDSDFTLACEIKGNQWVRTPHRYFIRWKISVFDKKTNDLLYQQSYDCKGQRVYVAFESNALGDTLAWFPAVEEFRLKHGCKLICSTFINDLFKEQYPEIEFVEPGETVHDLYAMYRLGWCYKEDGGYDYSKNVQEFKEQPLGQSAYDILGIDFAEMKPNLKSLPLPRPLEKPYVCIGFHSTMQAKYWNNLAGWDEVVRFLRFKGYSIVSLSREGKHYMGNKLPKGVKCLPDGSLDVVINYLRHAQLYIGLGSGLSWLSWAVDCKTCLISGFSYPYSEMQDCIRISPEGDVCSGCFNRHRLDQDSWMWCPDHQDTARMFECTRLITGRQVIRAITPFV